MAQADSNHSTPPTNTSANNIVDPSRRGFLAQAAAVAAGGAALGVALPLPQSANASQGVPDPIFAAIEAHKAARAVVYSACDDISAAEQEIGRGKVSEARKSGNAVRLEQCEAAMSAAHDAEDVAACVLVTIYPTTFAGVLALLEYATAADTDGQGWPSDLCVEDDDDGTRTGSWQFFLIKRLAEVLPDLVGGA